MNPLQHVATFVFSLLLHAAIITAGCFVALTEPLPAEKVYRVSLAAFAHEPHSSPSAQAIETDPATHEPHSAPPAKPQEPKPVPVPQPVPSPKPPKPVAPKRPKPQPPNTARQVQSGGTTEQRTPAGTPQQNDIAAAEHGPSAIGGLNAYAESAVEQRPSITRRALPDYPDRAQRQGLQGWVVVRVIVDAGGMPQQCTVHTSEPKGVFDAEALKAARKTRFIPGKIKGQSVNTIVHLPYNFTLRE